MYLHIIFTTLHQCNCFPGSSVLKNLPARQETWIWSPLSGRSSAEGNGNPFQCSCLNNLMDRGAWQATVHGVAKEWDMTWLSNWRTTTNAIMLHKRILLKSELLGKVYCTRITQSRRSWHISPKSLLCKATHASSPFPLDLCCAVLSHSVISDSLQLHGL